MGFSGSPHSGVSAKLTIQTTNIVEYKIGILVEVSNGKLGRKIDKKNEKKNCF
jgi:hypothetical protein